MPEQQFIPFRRRGKRLLHWRHDTEKREWRVKPEGGLPFFVRDGVSPDERGIYAVVVADAKSRVKNG